MLNIDFASAFPAPVVRVIGGVPITLPFLTATEFASYADRMRQDEWARALANEKAANFTPHEWFRVREGIDAAPRTITTLIEAAKTSAGAKFYVTAAMIKGGLSAQEAVAAFDLLDPFDAATLSMDVTRINRLPKFKGGAAQVGAPLSGGGGTGPDGSTVGAGSPTGKSTGH